MTQKLAIPALLLVAVLGVSCTNQNQTQAQADISKPLAHGKINLPEVSGIVALGNQLVVFADDAENEDNPVLKYHMIAWLKEAGVKVGQNAEFQVDEPAQLLPGLLKKLGPSTKADVITDLEDAATGPNGEIYAITSHSLNKKGKRPAKRTHLVRFKVNASTGQVTEATMDDGKLLDYLPEDADLKTSLGRKPGDADPGFNIEGLAVSGKDLLAGLRSPLKGGKATVLRLAKVDTWLDKPSGGLKVTKEAELDLGGRGIRGMAPATKGGYWVIAGLAEDPDTGGPVNDWVIYRWDGKNAPKKVYDRNQRKETAELNGPEAIAEVPGGLLLISDDGAKTPSSYVVVPTADLAKIN